MDLEKTVLRLKRMLPKKEELLLVIKSFSKKERFAFLGISIFFIITTLFFLNTANNFISVELPSYGGEFSEGIVGTPRFINPILAISDADRDLTSLVYAGLMKKSSTGGIVPELADSYTISPDGLSYIFTIKSGAVFHDGTPVTADDVEFTVNMVKDPLIKSPKHVSWEGVAVQKINDTTIKFTLKQKYFLFLENTTLGILPKHIWKDLTPEQFGFSDFNSNPVGAGPYMVKKYTKNSSGIPDYYELASFSKYTLGKPFIDNLVFHFYPNETDLITAFDNGIVKNISSVDSKQTSLLKEGGYRVEQTALPRVFAVFFNQNQNTLFLDKAVRKALSRAVDKDNIIKEVLYGYGTAIDSPLPGLNLGNEKLGGLDRYEDAKNILKAAGWTYDEKQNLMIKKTKKETLSLKFSISTGDIEELKNAAKMVKDDWARIGVQVDIKVFNIGDLNQNVIRPRKYDALLFGEIVGFDSDPFSFWHSSQRNDPGLNIALYTNSKVDKLLEDIRGTLDDAARQLKYQQFQTEIENDTPVVFLYSPDFTYMVDENLGGINLRNVTVPSDRFLGIKDWYLKTDKVWKPLVQFTNH